MKKAANTAKTISMLTRKGVLEAAEYFVLPLWFANAMPSLPIFLVVVFLGWAI